MHGPGIKCWIRLVSICALMFPAVHPAEAFNVQLNGPVGPVQIELAHAGPTGDLVRPSAPEATPFRPPSIFSAPLPSGSGARALGFAGAFTAVADDATAASWNPGGLIQLERPEASAVYRFSTEKNRHRSENAEFRVGTDNFSGTGLNYFSLAVPLYLTTLRRNAVFSLNYQEAYDFAQKFTADLSRRDQVKASASRRRAYSQTVSEPYNVINRQGNSYDLYSGVFSGVINTETETRFEQTLTPFLVSGIDYDQSGLVSALSPALALEITPKFSAGATLNYYMIDPLAGDTIRSRTVSRYRGESRSRVASQTLQSSRVDAAWTGTLTRVLAGGPSLGPFNIPPISTPSQQVSEERTGSREEVYITEGVFEEVSEFKDWQGLSATLGMLVHLSRALTVGAVADLPWTARAKQTKTVRNRATTRLGSSSRVVDAFFSEQVTSKDIEFEFPMYWAVGMVWRWTQLFYTTLDFSQTLWSDFSFKAEGEARINPVNGRPHREASLEDAMSIRAGLEKLFLTRKREIPLRAGFAWEERPSIEGTDDYYSVGMGSGISIGRDPGRIFLDLAYLYTFARKVRGFVPDQAGFATDVSEHQGYLSVIKHF